MLISGLQPKYCFNAQRFFQLGPDKFQNSTGKNIVNPNHGYEILALKAAILI